MTDDKDAYDFGWHSDPGRDSETGQHEFHGMDPERYDFLQNGTGPCVRLTEEEMNEGWHWCLDWDDLLVHPKDIEFECCNCSHMEKFRNNPDGKQNPDGTLDKTPS